MITIATAVFKQETNSFSPGNTGLEGFARMGVRRGPDVFIGVPGTNRELDGYIEGSRGRDVRLIPIVDAIAMSGPPLSNEAFEHYANMICESISKDLSSIDGVMLGLHGAMGADGIPDTEGELLARVRRIVGPSIPIAITLDLHAHFTARMAALADVAVGYQTCPHIDQVRTGRVAMDLLIRAIEGEVRPVVSYRKIKMMTSSETHDDRRNPNKQMLEEVVSAEAEPSVLSASLLATQPWLDVPNWDGRPSL